jgi:hypothetical protein
MKEEHVARTCSTYEEVRNAYRILVGNPGGNRRFGRPKVTGRLVLELIVNIFDIRFWVGYKWHNLRSNGGLF